MTLPSDHDSQREARHLIDSILTRTETGNLLEAIAEDIQAAKAKAALDAEVAAAAEARLLRLEKKVEALADAVFALTHAAAGIAQAARPTVTGLGEVVCPECGAPLRLRDDSTEAGADSGQVGRLYECGTHGQWHRFGTGALQRATGYS